MEIAIADICVVLTGHVVGVRPGGGFVGLLLGLITEKTFVVIAHRLRTITEADENIGFNKGQVIEEGVHQEMVNKEGLYNKLYAKVWDDQ